MGGRKEQEVRLEPPLSHESWSSVAWVNNDGPSPQTHVYPRSTVELRYTTVDVGGQQINVECSGVFFCLIELIPSKNC